MCPHESNILTMPQSSGKIILFDVKERKVGGLLPLPCPTSLIVWRPVQVVTSRWSFHTGKINSLSWTADGKHCASGSLDTHVYIWSTEKPIRNIAIKNAGPGGINAVFWTGPKTLASAGADGCVRIWEITFHA